MSDSSTGGISFAGALTIVFIGLKLANIITWSWWWVLSPIWISFIIGIIILMLAGGAFLSYTIYEEKKKTKLGRK